MTWATVSSRSQAEPSELRSGVGGGGGGRLADLRLTVEPVGCGNCSNYAIVLVPSFSPVWSGTGTATVDPMYGNFDVTFNTSQPPPAAMYSTNRPCSAHADAVL